MISKIDHLGIAVHSIAEARVFYEQVLGLVCERIEEVPAQKVRTAFFAVGDTHIELLEPTAPDSPVARFLEKRGEGFHHIGYRSDRIDDELARAQSQGCRLINAEPVAGAGGKKIAFLHPGSTFGVLTEICEQEQP
ncbi:MAG: methylmalonyl-CoA epimerase [Desulfobulbus sp.]|nr:MAG: methylmalonyl-CoA epimerase [Desulfobulbus sp.]